MTNREWILSELAKLNDEVLFKLYCRTQYCDHTCEFFRKDCRNSVAWMHKEHESEVTE